MSPDDIELDLMTEDRKPRYYSVDKKTHLKRVVITMLCFLVAFDIGLVVFSYGVYHSDMVKGALDLLPLAGTVLRKFNSVLDDASVELERFDSVLNEVNKTANSVSNDQVIREVDVLGSISSLLHNGGV